MFTVERVQALIPIDGLYESFTNQEKKLVTEGEVNS